MEINNKKKVSYFIPIVLAILLITSIPPISYFTIFLGVPLKIVMSPFVQSEEQINAEFQKEKELFPIIDYPENYDKNGNRIAPSPEEIRKIDLMNQVQTDNMLAYRNSHNSQTSFLYVFVNILYRLSGQITIIIISIIYYFFLHKKRNSIVSLPEQQK